MYVPFDCCFLYGLWEEQDEKQETKGKPMAIRIVPVETPKNQKVVRLDRDVFSEVRLKEPTIFVRTEDACCCLFRTLVAAVLLTGS